jgi:hypothetical protein
LGAALIAASAGAVAVEPASATGETHMLLAQAERTAPRQQTRARGGMSEQQILQNPMVQQILRDPELQQQIMDDPRFESLMQDPQVQRLMQNPQLLRQMQQNQQLREMYQLQRRPLPGVGADDDD